MIFEFLSVELSSIYTENGTMVSKIAEMFGGASVLLESRFYGDSNPYQNLSVQSLALNTIPQNLADIAYFVKNVMLPLSNGSINFEETPWICASESLGGKLYSFLCTFLRY